jgi:hypothetical protein
MLIDFPTHTVGMIIATMIAAAAAAGLTLSLGLRALPITKGAKRAWRWGIALLLGAWLVARLALAVNPPGSAALANQFAITFTSLGLGLAAGIVPLLISPAFRQAVRAIPETWLVGTHAVRLAGFLFLALLDMNLLPAEFALSAGYGDMAVGALSLGLVYLLLKRKPYARMLVAGWNGLGLLDFIGALTTGGLTIVPFAAQVAAAGVSLDYLNYVLIVPAFGVPLYALLHIYSLFQLATRRADETQPSLTEPAAAPEFAGERGMAQR